MGRAPFGNPVEHIRQLSLAATPRTIRRDLARAIALLKSLPTETERERAAVFMAGLSLLRSEWTRPRPSRRVGRTHR